MEYSTIIFALISLTSYAENLQYFPNALGNFKTTKYTYEDLFSLINKEKQPILILYKIKVLNQDVFIFLNKMKNQLWNLPDTVWIIIVSQMCSYTTYLVYAMIKYYGSTIYAYVKFVDFAQLHFRVSTKHILADLWVNFLVIWIIFKFSNDNKNFAHFITNEFMKMNLKNILFLKCIIKMFVAISITQFYNC